ncbi:hypothetical protein T492DRAFT_499356 [Pavlovales sp. CCMP2436]|nr:hypothetical protein T492DRAFT_499356 [Pavlovales sp. CCMP2436]
MRADDDGQSENGQSEGRWSWRVSGQSGGGQSEGQRSRRISLNAERQSRISGQSEGGQSRGQSRGVSLQVPNAQSPSRKTSFSSEAQPGSEGAVRYRGDAQGRVQLGSEGTRGAGAGGWAGEAAKTKGETEAEATRAEEGAVGKVQETGSAQHRRLLQADFKKADFKKEGRMGSGDRRPYLKSATAPSAAADTAALSAADTAAVEVGEAEIASGKISQARPQNRRSKREASSFGVDVQPGSEGTRGAGLEGMRGAGSGYFEGDAQSWFGDANWQRGQLAAAAAEEELAKQLLDAQQLAAEKVCATIL